MIIFCPITDHIYSRTKEKYTLLKSEYLQNQRRYLPEVFRKFSPNRCKWFRINFMSILENDHHHCTFFVISNFVVPHSQSIMTRQLLFLRGFPFTLKQQQIFFSRLALSVTCAASVRWLYRAWWDARAWCFAQQSCSSFSQFSQGYWPEPAEAWSCVFHCMWLSTFSPSACDIKVMQYLHQGHTLVQSLPNCLCHILQHSWVMCNQCQHWSQSFAGSTSFYPADPVCGLTPNVAGESPSNTDKLVSMPSEMKNLQVSVSPTHDWKSFSPVRKCCICVWWDFVVSISSFQKPTNLQRLNRDPM